MFSHFTIQLFYPPSHSLPSPLYPSLQAHFQKGVRSVQLALVLWQSWVFSLHSLISKHNRVKATSQEALLYSGYDTHVKQFTGWSQYCIKMITYAGEAVPSEPFVTFTDIAPVHVTTDRVFTAFTLVVIYRTNNSLII